MTHLDSARLFILFICCLLVGCTAVSTPIAAPMPIEYVVAERPSPTAATSSPTAVPAPTRQPITATVLPTAMPITPTTTANAPLTIEPDPTAVPSTEPPIYTYCAAPNDTVASIAAAAGVSEATLRAFNGMGVNSRVTIAQRLKLPPGSLPPHQWATPLSADALSYESQLATGTGGIYLGRDNRQMRVALTFDIGFNPDNLLMMAYLAQRNTPSTFFLVGAQADMVRGVLENGHELANHSWTHADLTLLPETDVRTEIAQPAQIVPQQVTGASNKPYFRPPYGAINETVRRIATEEGFQLVNWTVDSGDWQLDINSEEIALNVIDGLCPGAIVVMHGNNGRNFAALPIILDYIEAAGYEPVTLSTLMAWHNE